MQYSNVKAGGGFNPMAAGAKVYGAARNNPTSGAVDPTGYREREAKRKLAIMRAMKASQSGDYQNMMGALSGSSQ